MLRDCFLFSLSLSLSLSSWSLSRSPPRLGPQHVQYLNFPETVLRHVQYTGLEFQGGGPDGVLVTFSWTCPGHVPDISRTFSGKITDISWKLPEHFLDNFSTFPGSLLEISLAAMAGVGDPGDPEDPRNPIEILEVLTCWRSWRYPSKASK